MKKSNLLWGIGYLLVGLSCLLLAIFTETALDGLLSGLTGAGIGCGAVTIYKYFYWSAPKHRERYAELLKAEDIALHDELNVKLRDKAGRYAYVFGIYVLCVLLLAVSVLDSLGVAINAWMVILILGGYLALQLIAGIVIQVHLTKKYL
ncbi:MAG: hypothetical protein Q4F17_12030 [Eubacteriales bacterium]|nr:hypothetical protein [Eubacteriales bacterium]